MEQSTLARRSTRIASKILLEPRAKRARARAIQKENVVGVEKSSVKKNDSESVEISLLSSTGKIISKSRDSTKSKDGSSLTPSLLDVKTTEINAVKTSKTKEKENSKTVDPKRSESSISVVIPVQPRPSKRGSEKNYDMQNHTEKLIENHRYLASSSKKLATTRKELITNRKDGKKHYLNRLHIKRMK